MFLSSREAAWHQALTLWAEQGSGSVSKAIRAEGFSPKEPMLTTPAMCLSGILPQGPSSPPNTASGTPILTHPGAIETTPGGHSQLEGVSDILHSFIGYPLWWEGTWTLGRLQVPTSLPLGRQAFSSGV